MALDPKLACCNFIPDPEDLKAFAMEHGFDGIEWSFTTESLPWTDAQETALQKSSLSLEYSQQHNDSLQGMCTGVRFGSQRPLYHDLHPRPTPDGELHIDTVFLIYE